MISRDADVPDGAAPDGAPGAVKPIRVVLADDHPMIRRGLMSLLSTLPGVEVVGEAGTGRQVLREAALSRPDVVVMDLRMPELDGVETTRLLRRDHPDIAVLVLTMFDENQLINEALAAGARGYLLKGAEQDEIERAIRAVAAGDAIFSSTVADRILSGVAAPAPDSALPGLSERERQVLDLIAAGLGNDTIAHRLNLAPKTVGNHISSIFLKLGVATRSEAIVLARDAGFGRGE
jgi:DNA-binding NarL/FixJ family response regulator